MHPLESGCIMPMLLYFMAIPCMYMILPIYSICNLNNVRFDVHSVYWNLYKVEENYAFARK